MISLYNALGYLEYSIISGAALGAAQLIRASIIADRIINNKRFYQKRMLEKGVVLTEDLMTGPDDSPISICFSFYWPEKRIYIKNQGVLKTWKLIRKIWRDKISHDQLLKLQTTDELYEPPI